MNLKVKYGNTLETNNFIADNKGGTFEFTKEFTYLGSSIDFLMNNITDARKRVSKTNKAMGTLKFAWNIVKVLLIIKIKLY